MARICIVDDNPSARRFASASLKARGREVPEIEPTCLYQVLRALMPPPPAVP